MVTVAMAVRGPAPAVARVLAPEEVYPRRCAWAPWGTTGWSAVVVIRVGRVWARCHRVDPRTGGRVGRWGANVRVDEMVGRDPGRRGKDKPAAGPVDVLARARAARGEAAAVRAAGSGAPRAVVLPTASAEEDARAAAWEAAQPMCGCGRGRAVVVVEAEGDAPVEMCVRCAVEVAR